MDQDRQSREENSPSLDFDAKIRRRSERFCFSLSVIVVIVLAISIVIVTLERDTILDSFDRQKQISTESISRRITLHAIFFSLIILASTPFIPGASLLVTVSGYIIGWLSFPTVYCANLIGGLLVFEVTRLLVKHHYLSLDVLTYRFHRFSRYIRATEAAVKTNGWKSCALLQLGGFPFGLLNLFLGVTDIPRVHFFFALCISRLKITAWLSLGIIAKDILELKSITNMFGDSSNRLNLIISTITFVISCIALLYIYFYSREFLRTTERSAGLYVISVEADIPSRKPSSSSVPRSLSQLSNDPI